VRSRFEKKVLFKKGNNPGLIPVTMYDLNSIKIAIKTPRTTIHFTIKDLRNPFH
jgi:hypothetical protein